MRNYREIVAQVTALGSEFSNARSAAYKLNPDLRPEAHGRAVADRLDDVVRRTETLMSTALDAAHRGGVVRADVTLADVFLAFAMIDGAVAAQARPGARLCGARRDASPRRVCQT